MMCKIVICMALKTYVAQCYKVNQKSNVFAIVGYKTLNNAPAPCVISMAEESITKPRRSHARIVRPHQWHITR